MYCRGYTKTNFPCLQIVSGKYCVHHKKQYDMCSICYDDIVHPMRLQCNHLFCRNCIMKYEANTTELLRCPLCRKKNKTIFFKFKNFFMSQLKMKEFARRCVGRTGNFSFGLFIKNFLKETK